MLAELHITIIICVFCLVRRATKQSHWARHYLSYPIIPVFYVCGNSPRGPNKGRILSFLVFFSGLPLLRIAMSYHTFAVSYIILRP